MRCTHFVRTTGCLLALTFSFILPACSKRSASPEEKPDLIVLQTGRLRGNVVPDNVQGSKALQYYAYIAGYVGQVREEAAKTNTPVLLVDLGDSFTGSFASSVTHSANVATFFNSLHYDAVMLGNLDADVSPAALKALQMPVLCPFQNETGQPAIPGTTFATSFKKGDYEVQLLANFYGSSRPEEFPERFPSSFGLSSRVQPFRNYASIPKPAGQSPSLRVFQWLKFENEGPTPPALLGELKTLGIDLVLAHRIYGREKKDAWSGSSMFNWQPPVSLNILRNNLGFALARADLKREGGRWMLMEQSIRPMISNTAPADAAIRAELRRYTKPIAEADSVVAPLKKPLQQDAILDLYMSALAAVPGSNAALYSRESIRAGWGKGSLRMSDVFNSLPWSNSLVQIDLDAAEFASLRTVQSFRLLHQPQVSVDGRWKVTTSEFFARTVTQRLKLDEGRVRKLMTPLEYEFFASYLKSLPAVTEAKAPTGWVLENP